MKKKASCVVEKIAAQPLPHGRSIKLLDGKIEALDLRRSELWASAALSNTKEAHPFAR